MARVTLLSTAVRVAAIAATVISGTALLPSAPAQADPCPNIEVIFARGTHDDPGMGRVGSVLVDAIQPLVGNRTVTGYAPRFNTSSEVLGWGENDRGVSWTFGIRRRRCVPLPIDL